MTYRIEVKNFNIKLNNLLDGKAYDYRARKYRNPVKAKGDDICRKAIDKSIGRVKINKPVTPHYWFYVQRKSDRDGIISAFMKCFLDALVQRGIIENDTWDCVLTPVIEDMQVDSKNPHVIIELEVEE